MTTTVTVILLMLRPALFVDLDWCCVVKWPEFAGFHVWNHFTLDPSAVDWGPSDAECHLECPDSLLPMDLGKSFHHLPSHFTWQDGDGVPYQSVGFDGRIKNFPLLQMGSRQKDHSKRGNFCETKCSVSTYGIVIFTVDLKNIIKYTRPVYRVQGDLTNDYNHH